MTKMIPLIKNKIFFSLLLVLVLASFLRLWQIDKFPSGLNADEAAIGYNDYSLLQTGKDEHGNIWPIHFKSFGDYKPGGYFYLSLPFIKTLGLDELAIRLPSALLGILSVLFLYLLIKELFQNPALSLIGAIFLAISPWHIHFSRGGWETNAATTFILLGVWLFLRSVKNQKYLVGAIVSFVFAMYVYHSARIVAPFLFLGLLVVYRKSLLGHNFAKVFKGKHLKWWLVSGLVGFVLMMPLVFALFSPAGRARFSGVGILSQTGPYWRANELRGEHKEWNSLPVKLLHNKNVVYSLAFFQNYLDHFNGEFLFLSGDVIERNRVPETGQMYLFDIPFIFLGVYFLLKNRPKNWQVVFVWLAVAPIAAALTFQTPHALRAHNMVIPLVMISAFGFYQFILWLKTTVNFKLLIVCSLFLIVSLLWSVSRYLHEYFVHYPQTYPAAWEYGFKDLVSFVRPLEKDYDKILVTDKYDQPYILFLFYLKYPPEKFQKEVILTPRDKFGFSTVQDFGRYHFGAIEWNNLQNEHNILVVGTDDEIPNDANVLKTINFPNGKPAFKVAKL